MSIRYYPSFRVKTNLITNGSEFLLDGAPYSGKYYATYDGKFFSGANPVIGSNKPLVRISEYANTPGLASVANTQAQRQQFAFNTRLKSTTISSTGEVVSSEFKSEPTSYFPKPTEEDYRKGSIIRYFVKRINENGYVKEISGNEYDAIGNGTVPYDVTYYQIENIFWKLTGPLNTIRLSQYDIRAGIIDTNKRLVENLDKTFLGIKAFIAEDYAKFGRVTQ
jgi:hypothetical protein